MNIGIGLSTEKNPILAAKEATGTASINIYKEKIDLAIVFSSVDFSCPALLRTVSLYLQEGVPIIGCSGAAVISNQGIFTHGLVVMLLNFPEGVYFNTACVKDIKTKMPLNAGRELGEKSLKRLHIHLSGIEYGPKGEKNHLTLNDADLDLIALFKALNKFGCAGRIMCESPIMEEDALNMKKAWMKVSGEKEK